MTIKLDLDFVQQCFIDLATQKGIDMEELKYGRDIKRETHEWNINFQESMQDDFNEMCLDFIKNINLIEQALQQKDLLTIKLALMNIPSISLDYHFYNIADDCYKVLKYDSRFAWPPIPQEYSSNDYEQYDIHLRSQLLTHPERLDKFQTLMLQIAEYFGVAPNELKYGCKPGVQTSAWSLDYTLSLHDRITIDTTNMLQAFLLHHLAMKENDLLAAQVGLMHAAVCAKNVEHTIINLVNDCEKMAYFDSRFEWPELEDDSSIPAHYQYDGI